MLESGDMRTISLYYMNNRQRKVGHHIINHHPWSTSTMCLGFSCKTGSKIGYEVKFSEVNLKVNYVDKQYSGKYHLT